MSSLPRPPPSASILDAAVASPSLSTTILLALATALVLPLLLVALGASISDLNSPLAYVAIAVWCITAIIGAFAAHRGYRGWRARNRR